MIIKICGITTMEGAKAASKAGADFIGFVFADSKRKIAPYKAKEIASTIPNNVKKVGVFVNESLTNILQIAKEVDLDIIQLHGDEPAAFCKQIPLPTIKAFGIQCQEDIVGLSSYDCDYYLVDSPTGRYRGGNGTTFDWSLMKDHGIAREQLMLAGGLHAENIEIAISIVKPAAIDVSSGVETNGKKDPDKIKAFIHKAKQAYKLLERRKNLEDLYTS